MKMEDAKNEEKVEREKFLDSLKVEEDKKSKNIKERKNAQMLEHERKCAYLKAMNKILEKKDDTLEK